MQWLKDFMATAQTKLKQYNNATFKNAAMAVCALVAAADGTIAPEEKSKVAALITKNELLTIFNPTELRDTFLGFATKAVDEFERLELLNMVRKLNGDTAQADTVLRVALIIANADGTFDDKEKAVVTEICKVLGLQAAEYVA